MTTAILVLGIIIILAGLVGVFLPFVPGVPLVFIGILSICLSQKFNFISAWTIAILVFLALLSVLVDYLSGFLGAKYAGSTLFGLLGAILGVIFGISIFGPVGIFIGPALGVLVFELISKKSLRQSSRSAGYTLFSTVAGMFVNLIIALAMIGIFVGSIFV